MRFDDYISNCVTLALDLASLAVGTDTLDDLLDRQREMFTDHGYPAEADAIPPGEARRLRRLGDDIAAVLAVDDEAAFLAALAALLDAQDARPVLTVHDGRPHLHYARDGAPLSRFLGAVAVAGLVTHVCQHGRSRLRSCAATGCGRWYADASRNRSRRYCSSACASRTTVGAYRARLAK